ncbi:TPA: hypothetical protein ACQVH3_003735 [Serratia marcescens]
MTTIEMIKHLAQRNSVVASADVLAVFAELEAIQADAAEVFKEIGNELGCNPDNESIMMAIDELKKRLATPVRSPDDGLEDCQKMFPLNCDNDFDTGYNFGLYRYEQNIRAAGFKIEGEE